MSEPFGALRPSRVQEFFRGLGAQLPSNWFGRKAASLLLGPAGGRSHRAYDVEVFGRQKARLHPFDNICEKRVFITPQMWELDERLFLADYISGFGGRPFVFVDVGANVGLYTLFARAEAQRAGAAFKAVCVEADPEIAARLRFNLSASGAEAEVRVFNCAASDKASELRFHVNRASRGLSRVASDGSMVVPARTLAQIIEDSGLQKINAMKIDIEGHEAPALGALLADAPASLRATVLLAETSHHKRGASLEPLLLAAGYQKRFETGRNAVFVASDQALS